jgi:hypothetical protein
MTLALRLEGDERDFTRALESGAAFTAKATFVNGCAHFVPTSDLTAANGRL